jgi:phosphomannomutase/phosphoglucomutase
MQINPSIFREYDIRGIAGTDLNEAIMEQIGRAYPVYLKKKRRGEKWQHRRRRPRWPPHGQGLRRRPDRRLTACGVNVIDIGEVPAGVLYFALNTLKVDGGLMLTASHNPAEYNGLKVGVGKTTIYGDEIQKLPQDRGSAASFPR